MRVIIRTKSQRDHSLGFVVCGASTDPVRHAKRSRFGGSEPTAKNLGRDATENAQRFVRSGTVIDIVASRQANLPDHGRPAGHIMSTFQTLRKRLDFSIDVRYVFLYFYVDIFVLMTEDVSSSFNPKPAAQADRRPARSLADVAGIGSRRYVCECGFGLRSSLRITRFTLRRG